jgi:hypothetical protein
MFNREEIGLTTCTVIKISDPNDIARIMNRLGGITGENFLCIPNNKWKENVKDPQACVKIYNTSSAVTIFSTSRIQRIEISMPFLGLTAEDCWAELQLRIKRVHANVKLDSVVLGRATETAPMKPKNDQGTHAYLSLRLYHQYHKPVFQSDWYFEPLYVCVDQQFFYRIDTEWKETKIIITITMIENNSPEIPAFLRK